MTGIVAINILMVVLVGFTLAVTPYLMPPTECFTVTVPPSAKHDPRIRSLYRGYVTGVVACAIVSAAVTALMLPRANDLAAGLTVGVAILMPIAASLALMLYARAQVSTLKQAEGWTASVTHAAALVGQDDIPQPVPLTWELLHLVVVAALAAFVLVAYNRLPAQVPMHAGLDGSVTDYAAKSPRTVLFPILEALFMGVVFTLCHWGVLSSKRPIDPAAPATSAYAYGRFARIQSLILLIGGLVLNACMGAAFLLSWSQVMSLETAGMVVTAVGLIFAAAEILVSVCLGQSGGRMAADLRTSDGVERDDDRFYKLGVFYVNPNNPSIWIPKRFGVGWTLNYGRPMAWVLTCLFVVVVVGFAAGALLLAS